MKQLKQILSETLNIEEAFEWHLENRVAIAENVFRPHSEAYYALFRYAKTRKDEVTLSSFEKMILESDIGELALYEGEYVPLDHPLMEQSTPELNSPKRGGRKKFYVFVKNKKGNVVKVVFGDTSGLNAKINDPEARKSFAARHQCHLKKDKTTPGYWACRIPYYAKELGLKGGGAFFW
jgi:hypothetical protein